MDSSFEKRAGLRAKATCLARLNASAEAQPFQIGYERAWGTDVCDRYNDRHGAEDVVVEIKALFWDVGGVLLTNAWDHTQREEVLARFQLDPKEFAERHDLVVSSFERGKITLDEYVERTVFYRPRAFSRDEFKSCIYAQSKANPETLALAKGLAESRKYLMGTINNESRELNLYRIEKFGMRAIFKLFVSSCYVGLRKPEEGIYRLALDITQQPAEACCFIDDRALNLEVAKRLGMHTLEMDGVEQLRGDLKKLGVG